MANFELRQLTKDIANPDYDKRARYDDRSIARLKAGEKIIVRREKTEVGGVELEIVSFRLLRTGTARFQKHELVQQVLADSVHVEPVSFREVVLLHDEGAFTAYQVMERLFQNPDARPLIEAALKTELECQKRDDYQWDRDDIAQWNAT